MQRLNSTDCSFCANGVFFNFIATTNTTVVCLRGNEIAISKLKTHITQVPTLINVWTR